MAFTIENMASAVVLGGLVLSPDGSKLVYEVSPRLKNGDYTTSALWYSKDVTKGDNAKQLTSGLFNDSGAQWHPNSESIFFLSDRHKQGGPNQIYKYSMDGPGEPTLLNEAFKEKKSEIKEFQVSPDGNYIAFRSVDEPTSEEEKKDKEKDDAKIFGEKKGYVRLRLYTVSTGQVRTLVDDQNIEFLTWSPDSKSLAYIASIRPGLEAWFEKTSFHTISILPTVSNRESRRIKECTKSPISHAIWISNEHAEVYTMQRFDPTQLVDAIAVYKLSLDTSSAEVSNRRFYGGETEDVSDMTNIGSNDGEFAVLIAAGVNTRLDILNRDGKVFTLIDAKDRWAFRTYDVKKVGDYYVVACIRSSGPDKETPNVWVGKSTGKQTVDLYTKVSSHHDWVNEHKLGPVEVFEWTGTDGVQLNGIAWFPQNVHPSTIKKPLPTILHIHGGPYFRDTPQFIVDLNGWAALLAERGYLVLMPNYRGGSGRGSVFARAAYHGMGTIEWSDVNSMVDEAVKRGLADKDKLAIGGWSQGGFLTAWGISQTKNKFKCGIMGAGVSDWGTLSTDTDLPEFEVELGGAASWLGADASLAGDPIRHVKDVETAVLILHGEKDVRIPVSQGIGFHRGLRRMSKFPERHTLVVYPREGHGIKERKHGEDLLRRVIEHYDAWLK
ncbi:peptidase S9 prolyl oligopeptidase active site domain protein [Hysterangium stoloniferum]|nr:peptidase S9 prolyl oligopeptidase active site domain protein [Hysterangium stoloniferum]